MRLFLPALIAAALINVLFVIGPGHGALSEPFLFLRRLPGLGSIRDPSRFIIVPYALASLLIALAADFVIARSRKSRGVIGIAMLAVLVPLESVYRPQTATLSQSSESLSMNHTLRRLSKGPVVEVPMPTDTPELDRALAYRQYRGLIDQFPRPLGYSGGLPPEATIPFHAGRAFPDEFALAKLRTIGIRYILAHGPTTTDPLDCNARYSAAEIAELRTRLSDSPQVQRVLSTPGGLIVQLAVGAVEPPVDLLLDRSPVPHVGPRCVNP